MTEFRLNGKQPAISRELEQLVQPNQGGFNFDLCARNQRIEQLAAETGRRLPTPMKTGTTICGLVYKDGVVLGADTRATSGPEVCDKNCEKIHYLAPNIFCCGAGTAADTEKTTELISSQLDLLRLSTGTQSRVVTACTLLKRLLFRYQGHISAALVLGGVDCTGAHLYHIYPHGSTGRLPYATMGSGSLAAMAVFETGYRENMEEQEAVDLVRRAILSGVFNDLGSGSNVDITVIRKSGEVSKHRGFECPNQVSLLRNQFELPTAAKIPSRATKVLTHSFVPIRELVQVEESKMDTR